MANIAGFNPRPIPKTLPATTTTCCPVCGGLDCLDRTRFFAGQLLTAGDLSHEQAYFLAKNRLHNRYLVGSGVVCGLQVVCGDCPGWVTIKTGYGIDPCGNDIIVCQDYPFNVLQAIQNCCQPVQTAVNCAPLRSTPPAPTCQDVSQTWCITIQYQEQPSRLVTPLQPTSGNCGSGSQNGTNSRTSTSSASTMSSQCGCSTSTKQTTSTAPTAPVGACEATRTIEGFQIGVLCEPPPSSSLDGNQPGTFGYQFDLCYKGLYTLLQQKPTLVDSSNNPLSAAQAYQATCNYLTSVKNAMAASYITHCTLESELNNITISPPPTGTYQGYQQIIATIASKIVEAAFDCICTSFLPACPPAPCENRLILACVTICNGQITKICHFGVGRKQVVTFPALYYWLSLFNLDTAFRDVGNCLETICCANETERYAPFNSRFDVRENLTSAGFTNTGMLCRYLTSFVAQKLGAAAVNLASPTANTVDLRPLVNQSREVVLRALAGYNMVKTGVVMSTGRAVADFSQANPNITVKDVTTDPAWNDTSSSAAYAPAAFDPTQPLTLFIKGDVVVGFDTTSPTDVLAGQIAALQQQVNSLLTSQSQVQSVKPSGGAPPAPGNQKT